MRSILLLILCLAFRAAPLAAQGSTVVVLVRHAEKAATPKDDPGLTEEGEARARALVQALAGSRVDAIITSQFERTRSTAGPLAAATQVEPLVVPAGSDTKAHVQAVADKIRHLPQGITVVVIGHSNTVPGIIEALGGPELDEICETEFSNLFVLVLTPKRNARLVHAHYGAPDPPPPPSCKRQMKQ